MNCAVHGNAGVQLIRYISAARNDSDFVHDGKSDAAWIDSANCVLFTVH